MSLVKMASDAIHKPLRYPSDSIRLLDLEPGPRGSPISGTLREARLSEEPQYECISYTWGDEAECKTVELNGHFVDIRRNLWNFLQRYRQPHRIRTIWVDVLSISQTNLAEKGQQVQMIGRIFKQAERVVAWIGEESQGTVDIFRLANSDLSSTESWLREGDIAQSCASFKEVATRSYWSRTWVVQELILARSVFVWCGDDSAVWEDLFRCLRALGEKLDTSAEHFHTSYRYISFIGHRRVDYRHPPRHAVDDTICAILLDFGDTKCLNPLDKVYAILSLEKLHSWQKPIVVDYTIDPATLYLRVMTERHESNWEEMKDIFPEILSDALELSTSDLRKIAKILSDVVFHLDLERRKDVVEFVCQYLLRKNIIEEIGSVSLSPEIPQDGRSASLEALGFRLV